VEIGDVVVVHLDDLYLATSARLLEACQQIAPDIGTLALIGHNPGLEALALRLVGSGSARERQRMATKFPTCALAVIEFEGASWNEIGDGTGRLARFVRPKDLED
jgi:phosphohistidine phosphatase